MASPVNRDIGCASGGARSLHAYHAGVILGLELCRVIGAMGRAEFAGDADATVFTRHVAALLRCEAAQHLPDPVI